MEDSLARDSVGHNNSLAPPYIPSAGQANSTTSAPNPPHRSPEVRLQIARNNLQEQIEADIERCQEKAAKLLAEQNDIKQLAALALAAGNTEAIKESAEAVRLRAAGIVSAIVGSERLTKLLQQLWSKSSMDEFAQTRDLDDLFDDEFTPIPEPITEIQEPAYAQPQRPKPEPRAARARGNPRSPGHVTTQAPPQTITPSSITANKVTATTEQSVNTSTPPQTDPTTSAAPQHPKPTAAVRGDRTATGGITKPKLTEDELSERLAAVKLNNAKRAEAHRLAEADEASFQQREAIASQKRKEEGAARRVMNMEREKNRLRKLGAQGNREWDEGKEDGPISQGRGRQSRGGTNGGVYGGVNGGVSSRGNQNGPQIGGQGRGSPNRRGSGGAVSFRGGRGRGGGSGGSLNAPKGMVPSDPSQVPDPVKDFPALPTASSKKSNWADEMEEKEPAAAS